MSSVVEAVKRLASQPCDWSSRNIWLVICLKKLKKITSQIFLEDQSLDLFTSDYRKNPMFNWNPPVRDLLQAACTNDIDDQVELDEFQLVESYTQTDQTTTNNTDIGQNEYTVDVTVRSLEHSSNC